ncbi:hypothetical protein AGMMS49991_10810 [Spirochaetia bacterium]|nr:hypothetical protein AGMMS49991_10810 [Spirochaetia bacterium]
MAKKTFAEIAAAAGIRDAEGNPIVSEVLAKKIIKAALADDADPALVAKAYALSTRDDTADPEMREVKLLKAKEDLKATSFKLELSRDMYNSREFDAHIVGKIANIHRTVLHNFGPSLSGLIAAKLNLKTTAARTAIEEIITKSAFEASETIKRECNDYLIKIEAQPLPPEEEPPKKKKRPAHVK